MAEVCQDPNRLRPHLRAGVSQQPLDQGRRILSSGLGQNLESTLPHLGVIVVKEERIHEFRPAVRCQNIETGQDRSGIGATQSLNEEL